MGASTRKCGPRRRDSAYPLISAVGHETDWTLIDHAADVRAPTPTGAAEMAVPVRAELIATVDDLARRNGTGLLRLLQSRRTELRAAAAALPAARDLLALPRQRFDMAAGRLGQSLRVNTQVHRGKYQAASARLSVTTLENGLRLARERITVLGERGERAFAVNINVKRPRLDGLAKLLNTLSYKSVLNRGYALVRGEDGTPIFRAGDVSPGQGLTIEFADEQVIHTIADGEGSPAASGPPASAGPRKSTRRAKPGTDSQGKLF